MKYFVIYSEYETHFQLDGQPMYWSNEDGWVDLCSATIFTEEEKNKFRHLPGDGKWEQLKEHHDVSY